MASSRRPRRLGGTNLSAPVKVGGHAQDHVGSGHTVNAIGILWYDPHMPAKPVQISIDVQLLRRVDAQPETQKRGRSAFVRSAIESYLRVKERQGVDEAIAAAYGGKADAMLAEVEGLLDVQAWPQE